MKFKRLLTVFAVVLFFGLILSASDASAQGGGNSITGYVFGIERKPVYDANVELLDDLRRLVTRVRTDSSGRYYFFGMAAGRYTVHVMPYETDYEDMEQSDEIVNFYRETEPGSGVRVASGFQTLQLDFYLKPRRGVTGTTAAVFVQDVPPAAKKLFEKAVEDLNDKKQKEGLEELKAAIDAFPEYYNALERLGNEYLTLGNENKQIKYYEAAMILLKKATTVNPRSFRSWYGLAFSLNSLNQSEEALTAVQKALELYSDSVEALLLSGVLLKQNKKYEDAEKNLLKAKELSKDSQPMIHWHLALLYGNNLKRYADAAKELKLFLKAQPNTKDAEKIKALIKDFEEKAAKG
ncbi:MAG TPA: tetratricopeptide repeat protein [Pyrinomonadaceae bacterium]|jgi:tetratricopeptide (TPR) repeat protein